MSRLLLFSALHYLFSALNYLFSALCYLKTAFLVANHNREIFSCILLKKKNNNNNNKRLYCYIILEYGYVSAEVHLPLTVHKRTVMPHYKNSGLMSMWRCINSSDEWSRLQILWRLLGWSSWRGRIQGERVRFPVSLTCTLFSLRAFLRKVSIRKETSTMYRHVPNNGLLSASR